MGVVQEYFSFRAAWRQWPPCRAVRQYFEFAFIYPDCRMPVVRPSAGAAMVAPPASESLRPLMLTCVRVLLHIKGETGHVYLCRGFVPCLAGFQTLRPSAHARFADPKTLSCLLKTQASSLFDLKNFPTKIY